MVHSIRIDIAADVVCPWCVIGYKMLEQAIRDLDTDRFELRWLPFELNPEMPHQGENLHEHLMAKYGSTREMSEQSCAQLSALGQSLGVQFHFSDDMRIYNTFQAHQLLYWAGTVDATCQTKLKLNLFEHYFSRGRDLSDLDVLLECTRESGLDPQVAEKALSQGRFAEPVRKAESMLLERGIHAVPAFKIANSPLLIGARNCDELLAVLQRAL